MCSTGSVASPSQPRPFATGWTTVCVLGARAALPFLSSPRPRHALAVFRSDVSVPAPFWAPGQMDSIASGIQHMFRYDLYFGTVASMVWAAALMANTHKHALGVGDWMRCCKRVAARHR